MTDKRIEKIEWAATQWNSAWLARTALEVIREMQERERAKDEALQDATASLIGAVSLLESGGRKAAPSNTMFYQMLRDYQASVERARAALAQQPDDQPVASQKHADVRNNASCVSQARDDQPIGSGPLECQICGAWAEPPQPLPCDCNHRLGLAADQPAQSERLDGMADLSQESLLADAYARGQADMRERAAQAAEWAHMVPPDGGSPSKDEYEVAQEAARRILNLAPGLTDQPAQEGERPKCSHTRLTADRCPICGPLDSDNRPKAPDQPAQDDLAPEMQALEDAGWFDPQGPNEEFGGGERDRASYATADQPAQGDRLDPHTLERAAQVADNEAREAKKLGEPGWGSFEHLACRIRNLRDGGDT